MALFRNSTLFEELTDTNINDFLWRKKPFFLVLLCNCERDLDWGLNLFESSLGNRKDQFVYLYALPQTTHNYNLITTFQVPKLPTIIIDNVPMGSNNEKFRINEDISSWSWREPSYASEQMIRFVQGFLDETLPLVVRSQEATPLPFDEPGQVWNMVGLNFLNLVMEEDEHDWLILVYSPNCGACKALMPLFHDLARSMAGFPSIRVGTFDKTNNDFPVRGLFLKYYPTVYFFPAKHKYQNVNFYDFHAFHFTEEGLLDFIRRHADIKIDYKKALDVIRNKPKEEYKGDCITLTDENYDEIVENPTKNVIVDYFAPWCVYCKLIAPIWEELCTFYKDVEDVVVAKLDCPENEKLSNRVGIRSYPTIMLFLADNKHHPLRFRSERSLEVFKNFIESNRVKPVEVKYGQNGWGVNAESPCTLINGQKRIDLYGLYKTNDDYNVKSPNGEYEFFFQVCRPTQRRCTNKDGSYGAIQMGASDPKKHCYNLGNVQYLEAKVTTFGDNPISEVWYHNGERSDDFRVRTTKITLFCEMDSEEENFQFDGEDHTIDGKIVYEFSIRSRLACNVGE